MNEKTQADLALILVYSTALSTLIALSSYHRDMNPDTMIVYFASLVRWTPFFWAQDRYGMLIPALTQWIVEPWANVVVQNAVHVSCTLVTFFLLARVLFPHLAWTFIGGLAILFYTAFEGLLDVQDFYTPWQIYTPAMACGLAGVLVARRSFALALLLTAVAEWCNFSIFLITGLITLADAAEGFGRLGPRSARARFTRPILVIVLGAVFGEVLKRRVGGGEPGEYAPAAGLDALRGWVRIVYNFFTSPRANYAAIVIPAVLGLALLAWTIARDWPTIERRRLTLRRFAGAQFVLFAYLLVVGASAFAPGNGYPHRYLIPSLMMWSVAWAALIGDLTPARTWRGWRRWAPALVVIFIVLYRFGPPAPRFVKAAVADVLGPRYREVPAECTHVLGDYYRSWPVAFYSRFIHARTRWAISYRSEVTSDLWDVARFRRPALCHWADDQKAADKILARPEFKDFTVVTERGPMILRTRP